MSSLDKAGRESCEDRARWVRDLAGAVQDGQGILFGPDKMGRGSCPGPGRQAYRAHCLFFLEFLRQEWGWGYGAACLEGAE